VKVLVVTDSLETGGVEQHTLACLEELHARGHEARLLVPGSGALDPFLRQARRFVAPPVLKVHLERPSQAIRVARVAAAIRRADAVLFEAHSTLSCYYPLWLAARLGRPSVLVQQLFDPECAIDPVTRRRRSEHLSACSRVVAVSRAVAEGLSSVFNLDPERICEIPNGTDLAPIADLAMRNRARARWGVPADAPTLVMTARLGPQKRVDMFLDSLALLHRDRPDVHAIIAGDGPCAGALADQTRALGLASRVHFAGHVEEIQNVLDAGDVFVLSSDNEGLPIAVLEAMASGLCVVATAVGGTPEIVKEGETGLLVTDRSAASLAAAIGDALDLSPEDRRSLGDRGRQRVASRFSIRSNRRQVVDLLEKSAGVATCSDAAERNKTVVM